jgi:type I restriction enzyme R subunit
MMITESFVELATLDWLRELGYEILSGPAIAPAQTTAERTDYKQVLLFNRLQTMLKDLNPGIPAEGMGEALRKFRLVSHPTLIENNRTFHRLLVEGVDVEFRNPDGDWLDDKDRSPKSGCTRTKDSDSRYVADIRMATMTSSCVLLILPPR